MGKLEDASIRKTRPSTYLFRAGAAYVRAHITGSTPERAARELFGGDPVVAEILKSASSPAQTTQTGWAAELSRLSIEDTIAAVASLSAAADVINRGTIVRFDGYGSIRIPGRVFSPNYADAGSWVAEDAPIPVRQETFTPGVTLSPHKLAVMVTFSREQAEASAIEQISAALISESLGLALDAALFSNFAGDATRPPGLLANANVDSLAPVAGGDINAMKGDIGNLFDSLSKYYAGKSPVFIAAPRLASTLKLMAGVHWDYAVVSSAALEATKTIIAVELASLASAFSPAPEFKIVPGASIVHMEADTPSQINPGTMAVPVKSLFQVDAIGLRVVLRASFGVRAPGHVQVVNGCTW